MLGTIFLILIGWFLLSIPLSLIVARVLAISNQPRVIQQQERPGAARSQKSTNETQQVTA